MSRFGLTKLETAIVAKKNENLLISKYRQLRREQQTETVELLKKREEELSKCYEEEHKKRLDIIINEVNNLADAALNVIDEFLDYSDTLLSDLPEATEEEDADIAMEKAKKEVDERLSAFYQVNDFKMTECTAILNDDDDVKSSFSQSTEKHLEKLRRQLEAGRVREAELRDLIKEQERKHQEKLQQKIRDEEAKLMG